MNFEEKIPQHNAHFLLEEMDDEHLLYNPNQAKSIYLNSTASLIWRLCDGKLSINEIIQLLNEAFPDSKEQIRNDVISSVTTLVSHQALTFK